MKRLKLLLSLCFLATFLGCSSDDDNQTKADTPVEIEGSWLQTNTVVDGAVKNDFTDTENQPSLTFKSDGTFEDISYWDNDDVDSVIGKYKIDADQITMTAEGETHTGDYVLSDDRLSITAESDYNEDGETNTVTANYKREP